MAGFFTEGVSSSAERQLAIDEAASTVSGVPNVCVVPGVSAAVEEGEECVGELASRRLLHVISKQKQMTMIVLSTF